MSSNPNSILWRDNHSLVSIKDKIYVIGGRGDVPLSLALSSPSVGDLPLPPANIQTEILYPNNNMQSQIVNGDDNGNVSFVDFTLPVFGASCVSDNVRFIYCTGGFLLSNSPPFQPSDKLYKIDTEATNNSMMQVSDLGLGRGFHTSLLASPTKIVAFGGQSCFVCDDPVLFSINQSVEIDIDTNQITRISSNVTPDLQLSLSCAVKSTDDTALIVGGMSRGYQAQNTVYEYNINTGSISNIPNTNSPFLYGSSCDRIGDALYFYGNCSLDADVNNDMILYKLDIPSKSWSDLGSQSVGNLKPEHGRRCVPAMSKFRDGLVVHGGYFEKTFQELEAFEDEKNDLLMYYNVESKKFSGAVEAITEQNDRSQQEYVRNIVIIVVVILLLVVLGITLFCLRSRGLFPFKNKKKTEKEHDTEASEMDNLKKRDQVAPPDAPESEVPLIYSQSEYNGESRYSDGVSVKLSDATLNVGGSSPFNIQTNLDLSVDSSSADVKDRYYANNSVPMFTNNDEKEKPKEAHPVGIIKENLSVSQDIPHTTKRASFASSGEVKRNVSISQSVPLQKKRTKVKRSETSKRLLDPLNKAVVKPYFSEILHDNTINASSPSEALKNEPPQPKSFKLPSVDDTADMDLEVISTMNRRGAVMVPHRKDSEDMFATASGSNDVNDAPKSIVNSSSSLKFVVSEQFTPLKTDEISLYIGDVVSVDKFCDDGWAIGCNTSSGKYGKSPTFKVVIQSRDPAKRSSLLLGGNRKSAFDEEAYWTFNTSLDTDSIASMEDFSNGGDPLEDFFAASSPGSGSADPLASFGGGSATPVATSVFDGGVSPFSGTTAVFDGGGVSPFSASGSGIGFSPFQKTPSISRMSATRRSVGSVRSSIEQRPVRTPSIVLTSTDDVRSLISGGTDDDLEYQDQI